MLGDLEKRWRMEEMENNLENIFAPLNKSMMYL